MEDSFVVHVEDGECDLGSPVDYLLLLQFSASMRVLLLDYKLIEVSSVTELHDNVELLSFSDALSVGDDVDVLEFFEEFDLMVDVLDLLFVFVGEPRYGKRVPAKCI